MSPDREPDKVLVDVEGHTLTLTNLQKVLYPEVGFTKGQVIDYYTRVAPLLLPHLAGRALTMKRYPNGVDGHFFFEKNSPSHRPDWVRTVTLPAPGSTKKRETIDYTVVDGLATLVWVANLGSLELHTHMWRVDEGDQPLPPDLMVVDLDPGPGTGIPECCQVAQLVREHTDAEWYAKTSGSKGMQLYSAVRDGRTADETRNEMRELAEKLEQERRLDRGFADDQGAAARQGAGRLVAEQRRQDDHLRLLAPGPRPPDGVHPGDLGRGRCRRRRQGPAGVHGGRCPGSRRRARRPVRTPVADCHQDGQEVRPAPLSANPASEARLR